MEFAMIVKEHKTTRRLFVAWFVYLLTISLSEAHPHIWVDLRSQIILGGESHVSGIRQEWLFDEFYSAVLIEEALSNPNGLEAGLQSEMQQILVDLQPYNYFNFVVVDENRVQLGTVESFRTQVLENRIWMSFTAPVPNGVDIKQQSFSYSIFDPTYYSEMLYVDDASVVFSEKAPDGCAAEIRQPNPSTEAVALSQLPSLDFNPDSTIGQLFAETVVVKCY
jgi:ABC-type uncharacterized transport system substrate-binding protein